MFGMYETMEMLNTTQECRRNGAELLSRTKNRNVFKMAPLQTADQCFAAHQMIAVLALLRQKSQQSTGYHNSTREQSTVSCCRERTWLPLTGFELHRKKNAG